jgi:hypothetical protein
MTFLALLLAIHVGPGTPDAPLKQPQLAAAENFVGMTYGIKDAVYFMPMKDGGGSFGEPVLVSDSGKLSLGMHRGPRIAITPRGIVISAIVGEKGRGADGDLIAWRSTDQGGTWSKGARVNDVEGSAREGLHAMAASGDLIFATWLDLRAKGTRLYGSVSRDGGKTWSANNLVYESPSGTICQCCHPTALIDAKGNIYVMFRNAVDGARDMYMVKSTDRGRTFQAAAKLGEGTWILNACPMDGGGLAVDPSGSLISIWRRESQVYLAKPGSAEALVTPGRNPAVAATAKGVYAAWTEAHAVKLLAPGSSETRTLTANGGFPVLVPLENGKVLAAWESQGGIHAELLD